MEKKTIIIISVVSVVVVIVIIAVIVYFATKDNQNNPPPNPTPTCGSTNCDSNQKCVMDKCINYCAGNGTGCGTGTCVCPANKSICGADNICTSTCGPEDTCGTGSSCQCGGNETCNSTTGKCEMQTCGEGGICAVNQVQVCECSSPSTCNIFSGNCVENDILSTMFKSKNTGNIKQIQNKYIMALKKPSFFLGKVDYSYLPFCTWDFGNNPVSGLIVFTRPSSGGTSGSFTQNETTMIPTVSSTELLQVGAEQISLTQMKIIKGQRFKINSVSPTTTTANPTNFVIGSKGMYNKGTQSPGYFEIRLDMEIPQDENQYTAFDPVTETYSDDFVYTGDQLDALRGLYDLVFVYYSSADSTDGKYWGDGTGGLTSDKSKANKIKLTPELTWFFL